MATSRKNQDFDIAFGERLSKARRMRKLSQEEVADEFECESRAISNYECGTRRPSLNQLCKFAKLYGVTSDYLLGLDDNMVPQQRDISDINSTLENLGINLIRMEHMLFDEEFDAICEILNSEEFARSLRCFGRLVNVPLETMNHPSGIAGCKMINDVDEAADRIAYKTNGLYFAYDTQTIRDGLIAKAKALYESAIINAYYSLKEREQAEHEESHPNESQK